jgi:signal transduction histidine kinase
MNNRPTYEELQQRVRDLEKQVSRREDAERACHDSESRFRAMVEAFDGLVYVCSADYRIEFMNERLIQRTGRDATGELCYRVLHDRDTVCPWCVNERVLHGETLRWEIRSPKDKRWYYVINSPIHYSDGSVSKQAVILDITDHKQMDELLSGELEILESVATGRPVKETLGILVGLVEKLVDGTLCSLISYDEELKRYRHLAAPQTPLELIDHINENVAARLYQRLEHPPEKPDPALPELGTDEPLWHEHLDRANRYGIHACSAIPIRDGSGQLLGCFVLYHRQGSTLTPRELGLMGSASRLAAIAMQRHNMERELHTSAERIKMFSYSITHDLKSPAAALYNFTRRLHRNYREVLDDKGQCYCDQILKTAEQIAALVEKINLYIKAKELPLTIEPVNPGEILKTLQTEFAERLEERGIQWVEPVDLPHFIHADRTAITRILRNLVENALNHAGEELSRIEFGYEETEDYHVLSVSDNGTGIPVEDTDRLFEFFRRHKSSAEAKGAGLGLAIVKEIAQQHGGKVWVGPTPGQGTTFYISISKHL